MNGFWLFMFGTTLLMPLTMIGFGRFFYKQAPKEIQSTFGYRTGRSMKSREAWEFAHNYCGKLWIVAGGIMLPVSVVLMLLVNGKDADVVGDLGSALCLIHVAIMILSIIPVEMALKRTFNENGERPK